MRVGGMALKVTALHSDNKDSNVEQRGGVSVTWVLVN